MTEGNDGQMTCRFANIIVDISHEKVDRPFQYRIPDGLMGKIAVGMAVLSDKPTLRVKEIQDDQYRLIRIARPVMHDKTSVVDVCYEILVIDKRTGETKTISEVHSMRYFFRPELESYLEKAGFELIDNLDCATLEATDYDSWTSYFVARAV